MIINIEISKLHPHPDNPRKDEGDVSELAASIKESGVLQNLTVVPYGDGYRVIIGHRRLKASKEAGLTELPCTVVDMDYKTQIATMLCENMQRVDLTVTEQAQGVQMMLDLGESVKDISQKTGFSESTVRKRAKLSALPADKLKQAESRGGTLEDYLKCLEIENEKTRNELLEKVGTNDFMWQYRGVLRKQKENKNVPLLKVELKKLPNVKELPEGKRYSSQFVQVCSVSSSEWEEGDTLISDYDENEMYFYTFEYGTLLIFKKQKKQKAEPVKKSKKELEVIRRNNELKALFEKAYEVRQNFVMSFRESKKHKDSIIKWLTRFTVMSEVYYTTKSNVFFKKAIGDTSDGYYPNEQCVAKWLETSKNTEFIVAYYISGDKSDVSCYRAGYGEVLPTYNESGRLKEIYQFLCDVGYQMSTEEKQLVDGTHELYKQD